MQCPTFVIPYCHVSEINQLHAVFILGLPGSGKTTLADRLADQTTNHECCRFIDGIDKPSEFAWDVMYRRHYGRRSQTEIKRSVIFDDVVDEPDHFIYYDEKYHAERIRPVARIERERWANHEMVGWAVREACYYGLNLIITSRFMIIPSPMVMTLGCVIIFPRWTDPDGHEQQLPVWQLKEIYTRYCLPAIPHMHWEAFLCIIQSLKLYDALVIEIRQLTIRWTRVTL